MRGCQRRLVRPRRLTRSSVRAHGPLLRLPCFLLHPSLPPSFSSQGWCPPPRLRGPRRPIAVTPANHQPRPLAHVRAPKVQRQVLQVQVLQALALLVPQAPSPRRCPPSCPYFSLPFLLRTVLGALGARHGVAAGTQRLSASCYQKGLKEFFQLFVVPLLLLVAGVGFLLLFFDEENVLL